MRFITILVIFLLNIQLIAIKPIINNEVNSTKIVKIKYSDIKELDFLEEEIILIKN